LCQCPFKIPVVGYRSKFKNEYIFISFQTDLLEERNFVDGSLVLVCTCNYSVADPDPPGSVWFCRIRIRMSNSGSGSGSGSGCGPFIVVLLLVILLHVALLGTWDDNFYPLRTWDRGVSYDMNSYPVFFLGLVELLLFFKARIRIRIQKNWRVGSGSGKSHTDPQHCVPV